MQQPHFVLFAHLISHDMKKVLVCNDSTNAVLISRRDSLGTVTKVIYKNYFQPVLDPEAAEVPFRLTSDHFNRCSVAIPSVDPSLEMKLPNGVTIYGDEQAV